MTDNRTTERVDHPPRVREAIDELMRKKDATDNRTTELLPCPFCGGKAVLDKVDEGADYRPWFWYTVHCSNRDCVCADLCHEYETEAEAIAAWNNRATVGDEGEVDVDRAYAERIEPRLIEGTPTEDIRRWSVLAHSVMEVAGPSPFGTDGSLVLWLHESSLTQLLDMCDAVDAKFSEVYEEPDYGDCLRRLRKRMQAFGNEVMDE